MEILCAKIVMYCWIGSKKKSSKSIDFEGFFIFKKSNYDFTTFFVLIVLSVTLVAVGFLLCKSSRIFIASST